MTVTALAAVFLILLLLVAVFGHRLLSNKTASVGAAGLEQCSICRNSFDKKDLLERQIGDFAVRYFCKGCVEGLYAELSARHGPSLSP